jgi:polar amino acid transport system substrate-binding protein
MWSEMMSLRHVLSATVVAALLLAGCGGGEEQPAESAGGASQPAGESEAAAPAEDLGLINEGTLTVCTDSPYQPFEFEEDGEFTGFDVELLNAVAEGLGIETEYQVTPFDAIQSGAALNARQCDIAASAVTITEERAQNLGFTDPYFDAEQSLMVLSENAETYNSLDALGGQRIGVQAATTGQRYAEENAPDDAEIVEYPDSSALFQAIQGGEIAAILQDFPVNAFFATQNDTVTVVEQYPTGEQYGFAAQVDNTTLIDGINSQLEALRADGTYDEIYMEWFGEAPGAASDGAGPSEAMASEAAS